MNYDNEITVSMDFQVKTHQGQCDEMISCYIPSIRQYYSAKTHEDVIRKGQAIMTLYIRFFNEHNRSALVETNTDRV